MIKQATDDVIRQAAEMLRAGEIVAFPTETVYGLGADATSDDAIRKIYTAKNRPAYNPLITHVASVDHAASLAVFDERADSLAETLWPGPLTLVLPSRGGNGISELVTAGLPTITVRIPAHPIAMKLLKAVAKPIAAPSANLSGSVSPTTAEHVMRSLGINVPLILAGGASTIGLESTVLDLTQPIARILRPGAIGIDELEPIIGEVGFADGTETIKAPGQLKRHYATKTPLRLNAVDVKTGEVFLGFGRTAFIGVENVGFVHDMPHELRRNLSPEGDLHQAATNLYAYLHELDELGATAIAVQAIPPSGLGVAINDRLARAAIR